MKLHDRQFVEGTEPAVYIGHRTFCSSDGTQKISRPWYAEYCLHNRQRFEALRTPSKSLAVRKAHEICTRIRDGQPDAPRRTTTLKQVVDSYLELLNAQGRAPTTITKYELVARNVLKWSSDDGSRRAATLSEADFWSLRKHLIDVEGVGDKTAYDRLIVVKQMLKSAAKRRLISVSPFSGITMTKPESAQQPCFTPEQVGLLLEKADPHLKPFFATLAYAGLRFGEARDLLWSDLIFDKDSPGFIIVRRGGSLGKTKSKRLRRIPIHPELRRLLEAIPRRFERPFTALSSKKFPEGGNSLNERRALVSLKRLCRRCELQNPNQFKLHTFRHSFASMCARTTVSYKYALEWMGHRSSDILDLYYTMYDPDAHSAMRSLTYPRPVAASENATSTTPRKNSRKKKEPV